MGRVRAGDVEGAAFFPYEQAPLWAKPALLPFGLNDRDGVAVTGDRFVATFGRLRLDVPRSTVEGAHAAGPYRWWTSVGARLSFPATLTRARPLNSSPRLTRSGRSGSKPRTVTRRCGWWIF